MTNTKISYRYTDAANYKQHEEVVVEGVIGEWERGQIFKRLYDGEFFIPPAVGLDSLQGRMSSPDDELDHPWHILESIKETDEPQDKYYPTAAEFATRMLSLTREDWERAADEWNKNPDVEYPEYIL